MTTVKPASGWLTKLVGKAARSATPVFTPAWREPPREPASAAKMKAICEAYSEAGRRAAAALNRLSRDYQPVLAKHAAESARLVSTGRMLDPDRRTQEQISLGAAIRELAAHDEMQRLDNARRTPRATDGKRKAGSATRDRVLAMAQDLKASNPRMSKSAIAERIAAKSDAPCGFEQAKKYLAAAFDTTAWRKLGSSER